MLHTQGARIRTSLLLAVLLVALPCVGAAEAIEALSANAATMQHHGAMHQNGDLGLFRIADQDGYNAPVLNLTASEGWGYYFNTRSYEASTDLAGGPVGSGAPGDDPVAIGSEANPFSGFVLQTQASIPSFEIRVSRLDPDGVIQTRVNGLSSYSSSPEAQMNSRSQSISQDEIPDGDSPTGTEVQSLLRRTIKDPTVLTEAVGGVVDVRIQGDFIIEILGPYVQIRADDVQSRVYETGIQTSTYGDVVTAEEMYHLRLFIHEGDLRLHYAGIKQSTQWVSLQTDLEGDSGLVSLQGMDTAAEAAFVFPDGFVGHLVPGGDRRFGLDLSNNVPDVSSSSASAWYRPAGFSVWPFMAILVLGGVLMVFIRSRRSTAPPLEYMEQALEAGAFTRAARLASKILREDPTRESAHLGRAIAFSRTGQPERVVRNLESYLNGNDPSDGTLHYVLGLAYRDLGKDTRAQSALAEAVKRTPALAGQVPGYETPPASMSSALEGDAHGYT